MVELSEETKAILQGLKDEGLLTRNTGTNSIKSLGIKFDKFSGVLNSINTNIISQNEMMAKQLDISYDAATAAKNKEQFDEIDPSNDSTPSLPQSDTGGEDRTYKVIDTIGEKMASAFSLKNVAMGLAGGFVGYNLLKGFVDEKTNGGFTAFESNIGKIITDISKVDFSKFAPSMESLTKTIDTLKGAVDKIAETITKITEFGWGDLFGALWNTLSAITAYNLTMGVLNKVMAGRAGKAAGGGKKGLLKKLLAGGLGIGAIAASGALTPDEIKAGKAEIDADKANLEKSRAAQARYSRGGAGNTSITPRPGAIPDADGNVTSKSGKVYAADSPQGKMITTAGGTITPDQRAALGGYDNYRPNAAVPSPRAAAGVAADAVADSGGTVGKEVLARNKGRIDKLVAQKISGVFIKAVPGLGMIAGAGFALWSLARGDFTTAALEAASIPAPSLAGAPLDVGAIATAVFFEVTGETYNQLNEDHRVIMAGIGEEVARQFEEWKAERQQKGKDFEQRVDQMAANERMAGGGVDTSTTVGAFSGQTPEEYFQSLSDDPNFKGNYTYDKYGTQYVTRPGNPMAQRVSSRQERAAQLSSIGNGAGGGGAVIVNNNSSAPNYVTNVSNGGDTVAVSQNSVGGGGDGSATNFYNLPGGIQ